MLMMPVRPVLVVVVVGDADDADAFAAASNEVRAPPKLEPRRWLRRDVSHVTTQFGRVPGARAGGVLTGEAVIIVANTTPVAAAVVVGRLIVISGVITTDLLPVVTDVAVGSPLKLCDDGIDDV